MRWFRRRRTPATPVMRPFNESELESPVPSTLDHALEEGLMIAEYSARMSVKNRIVVDAIRTESGFDTARYLPVAAAALRELADESDAGGARIAEERELALALDGQGEHIHDYRAIDNVNLRRRERVAEELANALRRRADDEDALAELIETARKDAWVEIGSAIEASLDAFSGVEATKEDYERERPARLNLFIRRDLARLEEEHSGYGGF
ncbi:hypothetical protein [Diaminobutyricibacter sp. McL0608]|uniref:hypothetical protein n=1 Tax=Leifsonia sp. McL0608 TaxID=3143537 RepID=UPI0031F2E5A6